MLQIINKTKSDCETLLVCGAFVGAASPAEFTPTGLTDTLVAGSANQINSSAGAMALVLPDTSTMNQCTDDSCSDPTCKVAFKIVDLTNPVTVDPGLSTIDGQSGAANIDQYSIGAVVVLCYNALEDNWASSEL